MSYTRDVTNLYKYSKQIHDVARQVFLQGSVNRAAVWKFRLEAQHVTPPVLSRMFSPSFIVAGQIMHIPLVRDDNMYSKVIVWGNKSLSEMHMHPSEHCLFAPIKGSIVNITQEKQVYVIDQHTYSYIHDSIGAHALVNVNNDTTVTHHLYIKDFHEMETQRA